MWFRTLVNFTPKDLAAVVTALTQAGGRRKRKEGVKNQMAIKFLQHQTYVALKHGGGEEP